MQEQNEKRIVITTGENKDKILVSFKTENLSNATKIKEILNKMNLNLSNFEIKGKYYVSSVTKLCDYKNKKEYNIIAKKIMKIFGELNFNIEIQKSKTQALRAKNPDKIYNERLPSDYAWMD